MLEHLNHPFLCNLRYSFQDIEYLYAPPTIGQWLELQHKADIQQVHCCGSNEWRRFTISYFTKDFHRRGSTVLDGRVGLCVKILSSTWNCAQGSET